MGEVIRLGREHRGKGTMFEDGTYKVTGLVVDTHKFDSGNEICRVVLTLVNSDVDGNEVEDAEAIELRLSAGDASKIAPNEDGTRLENISAIKGLKLQESSNFALFLDQLEDQCGVSGDVIDRASEDLTELFVGMVAEWNNIPNPGKEKDKEKNKARQADKQDEFNRRDTVFFPVQIHVAPWGDQPAKPAAKGKTAPAAKGKTTPAAAKPASKANGRAAEPEQTEEVDLLEVAADALTKCLTKRNNPASIQMSLLKPNALIYVPTDKKKAVEAWWKDTDNLQAALSIAGYAADSKFLTAKPLEG